MRKVGSCHGARVRASSVAVLTFYLWLQFPSLELEPVHSESEAEKRRFVHPLYTSVLLKDPQKINKILKQQHLKTRLVENLPLGLAIGSVYWELAARKAKERRIESFCASLKIRPADGLALYGIFYESKVNAEVLKKSMGVFDMDLLKKELADYHLASFLLQSGDIDARTIHLVSLALLIYQFPKESMDRVSGAMGVKPSMFRSQTGVASRFLEALYVTPFPATLGFADSNELLPLGSASPKALIGKVRIQGPSDEPRSGQGSARPALIGRKRGESARTVASTQEEETAGKETGSAMPVITAPKPAPQSENRTSNPLGVKEAHAAEVEEQSREVMPPENPEQNQAGSAQGKEDAALGPARGGQSEKGSNEELDLKTLRGRLKVFLEYLRPRMRRLNEKTGEELESLSQEIAVQRREFQEALARWRKHNGSHRESAAIKKISAGLEKLAQWEQRLSRRTQRLVMDQALRKEEEAKARAFYVLVEKRYAEFKRAMSGPRSLTQGEHKSLAREIDVEKKRFQQDLNRLSDRSGSPVVSFFKEKTAQMLEEMDRLKSVPRRVRQPESGRSRQERFEREKGAAKVVFFQVESALAEIERRVSNSERITAAEWDQLHKEWSRRHRHFLESLGGISNSTESPVISYLKEKVSEMLKQMGSLIQQVAPGPSETPEKADNTRNEAVAA